MDDFLWWSGVIAWLFCGTVGAMALIAAAKPPDKGKRP
jgi:hypothetical protein